MACLACPVPKWLLGSHAAVLLALLVVYHDETMYTYPPSDAVAWRGSHGFDVHAGYVPWPGGLREVPSGTPGYRVVNFRSNRADRQTSRPRLGSAISALARQRGGLARSSSAQRLARVVGHSPQPPGSRMANVLTCESREKPRQNPLFPPSSNLPKPRFPSSRVRRLHAQPPLASPLGQAGPLVVSRTALSPPSAPPVLALTAPPVSLFRL